MNAIVVITFLSDFGLSDSYVSEVKGVLLRLGRPILVDITHHVPPFDISFAAFQLMRSYFHFPKKTWHMAIVDPDVGGKRSCLFVKTRDYFFVGPDNGLLYWAIRDCENRENSKARAFIIPVSPNASATFHARDVFAPFIVNWIQGKRSKLQGLPKIQGEEFPQVQISRKRIKGKILAIDTFGNLITSIPLNYSAKAGGIQSRRFSAASTYDEIAVGNAALIRGSHGYWEISCRQGSAQELLQAKVGEPVWVTC